MRKWCLIFLIMFLWLRGGAALAKEGVLTKVEGEITEFTLPNGMKFIVMERHNAPVVSFVTVVGVGSVCEKTGETGISHILEHMAFKGTTHIGTKDWPRERILLKKEDEAYKKWFLCSLRHGKSSCSKEKEQFERLKAEADSLVIPNEFSKIIEQNGGEDLNAQTSSDYTMYFCSLPANRVELWFYMESDRLKNPVWREFYTEKEVIREERRMRIDTSPMGKLIEAFRATAFIAHPYRHPTIGWDSDIQAITISDLNRYYQKYYVPENIVIAIVGDVNPAYIKGLAEKYFGDIKRRPMPEPIYTMEPPQDGPREVEVYDNAQPIYLRGYHIPSYGSRDYLALEVLSSILSEGRSSRLYRDLVLNKKLALSISASTGFPGERYPCLFVIFAIPSKGVSLERLSHAIDEEIASVQKEGVTSQEIHRAYILSKADILRSMESNLGMAQELAYYEVIGGSWRHIFSDVKEMARITPEEIKEVACRYLVRENMTEARLISK